MSAQTLPGRPAIGGGGVEHACQNPRDQPQRLQSQSVRLLEQELACMDDPPRLDRLVSELNSSDLKGPRDAPRFEEWITILRGHGGSDLYLVPK